MSCICRSTARRTHARPVPSSLLTSTSSVSPPSVFSVLERCQAAGTRSQLSTQFRIVPSLHEGMSKINKRTKERKEKVLFVSPIVAPYLTRDSARRCECEPVLTDSLLFGWKQIRGSKIESCNSGIIQLTKRRIIALLAKTRFNI